MMIIKLLILTVAIITTYSACVINDHTSPSIISPGNDPNFKIVVNNDGIFKSFNRKVVVFGVDIYAVAKVKDVNLLHAANVLAQYLDNNEDGSVDNQLVIDNMIKNKAFVVMWEKESDLNIKRPRNRQGQDLGNHETHPNFVTSGNLGEFDATLEEIWHIITSAGYADAYPTIFAENGGTLLTDAMDIARGGDFKKIPNPYPANAWYTYGDETCEYDCMATEYIYWAMTSILGAQKNRLSRISREWDLNTAELVQNIDTSIYSLLTDPRYKFPTVLPDGTYKYLALNNRHFW
jgi:hypothetical protein